MQFLSENYELALIIAQVAGVALVAALTGFLLARWMYKQEASSRDAILNQEILRLRRKVTEGEAAQSSVDRYHHRLRRQGRNNGVSLHA